MTSKRTFLLLLTVATSALATAVLPERSGELEHVPVPNMSTSKLMAPASTSTAIPGGVTMRRASRLLTKRDYYTCYQISASLPNPYQVVPEDCQTVVDRVASHEGSLNVLPGTCLVWLEGTCGARFCAAEEVTFKGLNQTFQWVGEQLDHLFRSCVANGQDGLKGDCEDLDGNCGFYRLHLEHRGNDWPNSTGSGI